MLVWLVGGSMSEYFFVKEIQSKRKEGQISKIFYHIVLKRWLLNKSPIIQRAF